MATTTQEFESVQDIAPEEDIGTTNPIDNMQVAAIGRIFQIAR